MAYFLADRPVAATARGAVAVLGNFDGVHVGHRALIEAAAGAAEAQGAPLAAATFEPHPRRLFQPDAEPFLLTTLDRRDELLRAAGAAHVVAIPFTRDTAGMSPEEFVDEMLIARLGLAGVVVGSEFEFGKGRTGNADSLAQLGATRGLFVGVLDPVAPGAEAEKYSSTDIRSLLEAGDVTSAATLLGRPWDVRGTVKSGEQRGRTIGFPTANLDLGELVRPKNGVYAVRVGVDGAPMDKPAVANFGRRPTVGGEGRLLEVHVFDFTGDLYGRRMDVAFIEFLREERKFDGLDALKTQIAADGEQARALLSKA